MENTSVFRIINCCLLILGNAQRQQSWAGTVTEMCMMSAMSFDTTALSERPVREHSAIRSGPGQYTISSPFGFRADPSTGKFKIHNGIDFAAASGTPIYASESGTVYFANFGLSGSGFGDTVMWSYPAFLFPRFPVWPLLQAIGVHRSNRAERTNHSAGRQYRGFYRQSLSLRNSAEW